MKLVAAIIGIVTLSILSTVGFLYLTQNHPVFGNTSLTTINGSDQISTSRTTLNNNFSSLNANKVEISDLAATTSLQNLIINVASQLSGIVAVANGGTASTSISANQVILGNGTSGFNEVNGFGTSGQFLTSGGAGVAPTWTSNTLDTTLSFNWTGTYFGAKNFYASSTAANPFYLNGLSFDTPAIRGASSTVLTEDGNGHLNWLPATGRRYVMATSTSLTANANLATATSTSITIPAGVLNASSTVEVIINGSLSATGGGNSNCIYNVRNASGVNFSSDAFTVITSGSTNINDRVVIVNNNSVSSQVSISQGNGQSGTNGTAYSAMQTIANVSTSAINLAAQTTFAINIAAGTANVSSCVLSSAVIIVNP